MATASEKLYSIKAELDSAEVASNSLKEGVDIKLDRAERRYDEIVERNCDYILSRSNYKVFKALTAYEKRRKKQDGKKNHRGFIEAV